MRVLVAIGRRVSLLLQERSRRHLVHEGFRDRVVTIKAKAKAPIQVGQTICYLYHQLGHMKQDCPKGRDPRVSGQCSPSHQWDRCGHSLFLHSPIRVRGTSISLRVLHKHLLPHRQAKEARVWVKAEDRAYKLGHQGFRGVSTPS